MISVLFISGIIGGVIGGMGMGGGTLLIPLLTIFCGVEQHVAQAVNLLSFIPMSLIALFLHSKKGFVKTENIFIIIVFGVCTCVLGSLISKNIEGEILKRIFGFFLIFLSFYGLFKYFVKK